MCPGAAPAVPEPGASSRAGLAALARVFRTRARRQCRRDGRPRLRNARPQARGGRSHSRRRRPVRTDRRALHPHRTSELADAGLSRRRLGRRQAVAGHANRQLSTAAGSSFGWYRQPDRALRRRLREGLRQGGPHPHHRRGRPSHVGRRGHRRRLGVRRPARTRHPAAPVHAGGARRARRDRSEIARHPRHDRRAAGPGRPAWRSPWPMPASTPGTTSTHRRT